MLIKKKNVFNLCVRHVCQDFMKEVARSVSSISFSRRSRFVILDHSVDNEE